MRGNAFAGPSDMNCNMTRERRYKTTPNKWWVQRYNLRCGFKNTTNFLSISPPGNQVVTVWPRHLSSSAATRWRTTTTSRSHQTWCFSANQRAAWVYASVGLAFVTTPHLFSRWPTRTQESPATESASTSTVLFSEDITALVGTRVATQRQQHRRRRLLVKGPMAAVEAQPPRYLHLTMLSQRLCLPPEKRADQVPS